MRNALLSAITVARLSLILLFALPSAFAQQLEQDLVGESIHWAYSSYFGTGWYSIGDNRDAYVFRMTPRWALREASIDEDGKREFGFEFRFPITAGLDVFSFEELPDVIDLDNLASLSVVPGVDVDFPISERWTLRAYGALGWGTLLNGSESSWIYWGGIKSRYTFQHGELDWAIIATAGFVGYSPSDTPSQQFWPLMVGTEFDYPLGNLSHRGDQLMLNWHVTYTSFEERLDDLLVDRLREPITDQWEIGLSLSKQDKRITFWKFGFDRLGLASRFNSGGDLRGVSFVFRSVFDQ